MTLQSNPIAATYVHSVNDNEPATFHALFAEDANVNDNGRQFSGLSAIKEWSQREIFDVQVTLQVLNVTNRDGGTVLTTKVDGNFDRTGLPDPVVIDHQIEVRDNKIIGLTCRLAAS